MNQVLSLIQDYVESKTKLFADDCIVYRNVKSFQDCQALQHDLDKLAQCDQTWGMFFHPDKCNILRAGKETIEI